MNKAIRSFQQEHMNGFTGKAISFGNSKLSERIMTYNLTSAHNCASCRLGMCAVAEICYAKNGENRYKNYLRKNLVMEEFNKDASPEKMFELVRLYWNSKRKKADVLRLDEAGEFVNQEMVDRVDEFARLCKERLGLTVYTYTARKDLDFTKVRHMQINGSNNEIKGALRHFIAVDKKTFNSLPKGTLKCNGTKPGCGVCTICFDERTIGRDVYVKKHR